MNYQETIDYLFHAAPVFEKVGASAYKEGLSNTIALDEHFGHPHRQYRTIHVAGTTEKAPVRTPWLLSCKPKAIEWACTPHRIWLILESAFASMACA